MNLTENKSDRPQSSKHASTVRPDDVAVPMAAALDDAVPLTAADGIAETAILPEDEIVPARHRSSDRAISGIDLIDFGVGGLLPEKVYLIRGGSGMGKSIAGLQFLTRGLEHQEPGVLITDQRPANVVAQATSVGFPIEEAVRRGQLAILNPSLRYFELVESPADIQAIVDELADYIRESGARRLVIDPIYTLINTQYSAHFALMVTQSLLNALEDLPATTLLVAGDDQDPELSPIVKLIEHNAFGVVTLSRDEQTGGRLMSLSGLRYANSENLNAHYRILNGRGLMNYRGEGESIDDVTQAWEVTAQTNRRVLLVGAPPETVRSVREALGDAYEISSESELDRGVERARREKPGLVIVTPSRSIAAAGAILDLARDSSSSIAFLSPETNRKSDRILYLRAGADDFIVEPFAKDEFRARVDALVRRSGRRLTARDPRLAKTSTEELAFLMSQKEGADTSSRKPVIGIEGDEAAFAPEFHERLQRSIDAVSKLDTPFAVYWLKAEKEDADLSRELAGICRQEDILCHNRHGEFVAILTGTDQHGVRGFENRLNSRLGERLAGATIYRGYDLHQPGEQRA